MERVVGNELRRLCPVTIGIPQGSVFCPTLFNISTDDLDEVFQCTICQFVELGVSVCLEDRKGPQRDMDKLD